MDAHWREFLVQAGREIRVARLQRAIDLLVKYKDLLRDVMGGDFGGRHPVFS